MSVSTVERSAESIVRSFWEDFWNRSDLATGKEIMTPHLYQRTVEYMKRVHAVFPDAHWIVEDMVTDGATVVTRYTWSGTQLGVMGGLPQRVSRLRWPASCFTTSRTVSCLMMNKASLTC